MSDGPLSFLSTAHFTIRSSCAVHSRRTLFFRLPFSLGASRTGVCDEDADERSGVTVPVMELPTFSCEEASPSGLYTSPSAGGRADADAGESSPAARGSCEFTRSLAAAISFTFRCERLTNSSSA